MEPRSRRLEDPADAEVDRADEDADHDRDEEESHRRAGPERGQAPSFDLGGVVSAQRCVIGSYWRSRASAEDIARKKFTSRGPQRDAIESSMRTIEPVRTALMRSQPGRDATVAGLLAAADGVREHDHVRIGRDDVLGRELRIPPVAAVSASSAMFSSPSSAYAFPMNVFDDAEKSGFELVVHGEPAGTRFRASTMRRSSPASP